MSKTDVNTRLQSGVLAHVVIVGKTRGVRVCVCVVESGERLAALRRVVRTCVLVDGNVCMCVGERGGGKG